MPGYYPQGILQNLPVFKFRRSTTFDVVQPLGSRDATESSSKLDVSPCGEDWKKRNFQHIAEAARMGKEVRHVTLAWMRHTEEALDRTPGFQQYCDRVTGKTRLSGRFDSLSRAPRQLWEGLWVLQLALHNHSSLLHFHSSLSLLVVIILSTTLNVHPHGCHYSDFPTVSCTFPPILPCSVKFFLFTCLYQPSLQCQNSTSHVLSTSNDHKTM